MNKAGKNVLWFLAGCMAFTDITIGTIARVWSNVSGEWIITFGFLSLLAILAALLSMYIRNPAFILAVQTDVIPLSLIQSLTFQNDPELLKQLLIHLSPASLKGEEEVNEEEEEETLEISEEDIDEDEESVEADRGEFYRTYKSLNLLADGG